MFKTNGPTFEPFFVLFFAFLCLFPFDGLIGKAGSFGCGACASGFAACFGFCGAFSPFSANVSGTLRFLPFGAVSVCQTVLQIEGRFSVLADECCRNFNRCV